MTCTVSFLNLYSFIILSKLWNTDRDEIYMVDTCNSTWIPSLSNGVHCTVYIMMLNLRTLKVIIHFPIWKVILNIIMVPVTITFDRFLSK